MYAINIAVAIAVVATTSGCVATSYKEISYPTLTGHIREEIDPRTETISLHFDSISVEVGMREEAGKTETVWIGVVPIPQSTGETEKLRVQKNSRIRFWILIKPIGKNVAYAPMRTILKKGDSPAIYPAGYLQEYDWLYSDLYPLTDSGDTVLCPSNTDFNVVFDMIYDAKATYQLTIDGITKDGIPINVPTIRFVPKGRSHVSQ